MSLLLTTGVPMESCFTHTSRYQFWLQQDQYLQKPPEMAAGILNPMSSVGPRWNAVRRLEAPDAVLSAKS